MPKFIHAAMLAAVLLRAGPALAKEIPVGPKQKVSGMEIGAVYLQPIEMDPPGMMRAARDSDIHLESEIKAEKDNTSGFATGVRIRPHRLEGGVLIRHAFDVPHPARSTCPLLALPCAMERASSATMPDA